MAVRDPLAGTWPGISAFRSDHKSFRVRMQRFGDEQLARLRSVCVRSVDQINAEFDRAFQNFDRVRAVRRPTPNAFTGDPHGAETESIDLRVAADFETRVYRRTWR